MALRSREHGVQAVFSAPDTDQSAAPAAVGVAEHFDQKISEIKARRGDSVPVEEVAAVFQSLLETLGGDLTADDLRLYHEVEKLGRYIRAAKTEIAALNPVDIREEFLPTATDELDAIVQATEKATGEIMDATEGIEEVIGRLERPDLDPAAAAAALQDATTHIYEACSFQDITGQRITKIVRVLKSIEARVESLVQAFDPDALAAGEGRKGGAADLQKAGNFGRETAAAKGDKADDDALLNGPQAEESAMAQDDIDALLASFD